MSYKIINPNMWKIKLVLEGGLVHTMNDVRSGKPGWNSCQASGIERLEFNFIGKQGGKETQLILVLAGMSAYNFFVESSRGIGSNKTVVRGLWFLGRVPGTNKVTGFVIRNKVQIINTLYGREYSGIATIGWKKGFINGKVVSAVGIV